MLGELSYNRRLVMGAIVVSLSFLFTALFCEWGIRKFNLSKTWTSYKASRPTIRKETFTNETVGRIRPPGLKLKNSRGYPFETNSFGFRDDEWGPESSTEFRVALIGDSVTEGFGIEKSARFGEQLAHPIRALNFGVADSATADEVLILQNHVFQHKPKVVFLQFGFNDIEKNNQLANTLPPLRTEEVPLSQKVKALLSSHSAFYLLLAEAYQSHALLTGSFENNRILQSLENTRESEWQESFRKLAEIAALCRSHSVPLIVSYFPLEVEVLVSEESKGQMIEKVLQNYVENTLAVRYFNISHVLRAHKLENLYLDDVHLTAQANKRIAENLSPYLLNIRKQKLATNQHPENGT